MSLIIFITIGVLVGWVASLLMRTETEIGVVLNAAVGIAGALAASFTTTRLTGQGNIFTDDITARSIVAALGGAIIMLFALNFIRRFGAR